MSGAAKVVGQAPATKKKPGIGANAPRGVVVSIRDCDSGISAFLWKEDDVRYLSVSVNDEAQAQRLIGGALELLGGTGVSVTPAPGPQQPGVVRFIVAHAAEDHA